MRYWFTLFLLCTLSTIHAIQTRVPFNLLEYILPPHPIILEAGGHIGQDTKWMAELWHNGTIHSFEPHYHCFEILKNATIGYPNVALYPIALSNKSGIVSFYVDGKQGGASSLLRPTDDINNTYFHIDLSKTTTVSCTTIDLWAQENNISIIDFFWIDVEGNELQLLQGAEKILENVRAIYTEVNLRTFWHGCTQYHILKKWLSQKGFTEVWTDLLKGWNGNVVFVNNAYKHLLSNWKGEKGEIPEESHYLNHRLKRK